MKNTIEEYIPFEHKNIEYINGSLNLAREQRQGGFLEGFMASTLIYTNLVEYLADHLLNNLQQMFFLISYNDFNGVFFIKNRGKNKIKSPRTLGQLRNALGDYEFPDSTDFLSSLQKFSETRNAIFHRLLIISKEEIDKGITDQQFFILHNLAEEILDKYNKITSGIATIWYSTAKPQLKRETPTAENLQLQLSALIDQAVSLQTQLLELTDNKKNKNEKEIQ